MTRSKKIFFIVLGLFFLFLIYISYDISRRTTFPGSKAQLPARIKDQFLKKDSAAADSAAKKVK